MTETRITTYGELDQGSYEQIERCAQAGDCVAAALMADHHLGYSQPIGGVVAYKDQISPSGVGYDIACGNKAVRTNILADEIRADVPKIMDEIAERISFGMGRANDEPVDHPVLDEIRNADFAGQRALADLATKQLGTVGSGNHYVDLFAGDDGWLWIGNHFGSRGFGHKTASGFLALAEGKRFEEHASEGEMHSPPILFGTDTDLGQSYIAAMTLAGKYAYAGRDVVIEKVIEILGATATFDVHNHHNFAWQENHFGEDCWVIRKGATPAAPGQLGFVGSSMGEDSVIIEGRTTEGHGANALYSTIHGAGRVMSRTMAAGKSRKRWTCDNRDCDWFAGDGEHKPDDGNCPKCGYAGMSKRMQQITEGVIDWSATKVDLKAKGIELRGAVADEAPGAYKRLPEVLAAHDDQIRVLHTLKPLGVAMAGADVFDPYKD
ncbi:MAG: RtcB family protein [Solirubrobacterales bacterium]